MRNALNISETTFFERARAFLREISGKDCSNLHEDTDLVASEFLDSILLIAFLCFLEEQRGSELTEITDLGGVLTLRSAYSLITL